MIIGCLFMGLFVAIGAAVTCVVLGHGLLIAALWYVLGGMIGMGVMAMGLKLRQQALALLPGKVPQPARVN